MKSKLNRRLFLRGLGGAAVAAPFLGSIQERPAHAQTSDGPKRLIVMFTHYGCLTNLWFPQTSHGPLSAAELQDRTISPLAPYVNKLLLPRGIRAMNEWNFSHARGQGNDPHTNPTGSFFSCQPITPHNQVHAFNDAKTDAMPIDRTLDHVIAEQISTNAGGVPLYMRLGGFENEMTAISYSGPSERFSGISSAAQVYSNITGLFQDGEPMTPDSYAALKGQSVIDIVRDDLTRLEGFNMSGADRQKLEAWKELLHEAGGVVSSAQCNPETATALGLPADSAPDIMSDIGGGRDVADLFSDLAVLAAICDLNRVIFLKYPGNYTFSGLGHTADSHGLSHRIGNPNQQGDCVDGVLSMLEDVDRYYAEKFAYLVGQLDSFDEGEGTTVLDNSATIWFNELSDGNAHNMNNMPILHAGSCGGYFKTGQAVNLDGGTNDLTPGNSLGQCADGGMADGISQATGTSAEIASRPINKYFCNIMNAVGCKAGPDGFPLAGGSGEVTHFGRWDRTEDFRNGPDGEPPLISDPGEFSELRA